MLRRAVSDVTFLVKGIVPNGRQQLSLVTGFNIVTYTGLQGSTLTGTALIPGVLTNAPAAANADIVYVDDGNGALVQYFNTNNNPTTGWRKVSAPGNQGTLPVKTYSALLINKRAGSGNLNVDEQFVAGP